MATKKRRRRKRSRRSALRRALPTLLMLVLLAGVTFGALYFAGVFDGGEPEVEQAVTEDETQEKQGFFAKLFGKNKGEEQTEEPQEEEKKGFFARLFGGKDKEESGSIFGSGNESGENADPEIAPEPTPTPVPDFTPYSVAGTSPTDFGMVTAVEVDGTQVSSYTAAEPIDFEEGYKYTDVEGVISFRGNNFRDNAAYGTVSLTTKKFNTTPWTFNVGSLRKMYGEGSWTGCGWTGQPLIVRWPQSTKNVMNMYDWAKAKEDLVEVIYATLDGNIYFLDLASGQQTREPVKLGYPFKGAGALDPRGYPIMYVGSGDDSPTAGKDSSHAFIISLIDGSVLYEFGYQDNFRLRDLSYFDSSALVDAETDTLIYPGENGILYLIKLNTQYDEAAGTLSINPGKVVKWRYKGAQNGQTGVDGSEAWWLGIEDSAIVWRGHIFFTDNGGHMMCLDINTLELVWVQDTLDDTNCTGVLDLEGNHPYIYTSTSFHGGWRKPMDSVASIPIWKIDAVTGEKVWTNENYTCQTMSGVSGGVQGSFVSGKNNLSHLMFAPVAMTNGSKGDLVALNKSDGSVAWRYEFQGYPWSSPVAIYDEAGNGYIIQCTKSGYLHIFDGLTGVLLDEMNLGSNIEASPAVFENTVVVGTRGGLIYGVTIE